MALPFQCSNVRGRSVRSVLFVSFVIIAFCRAAMNNDSCAGLADYPGEYIAFLPEFSRAQLNKNLEGAIIVNKGTHAWV